MSFRITGLSPEPFLPLFGRSDAALAAVGARRIIVDESPGYPDRIGLCEVAVGQTVLLVNHVSQPAPTPYRATHAIYVAEGATAPYDAIDRIPEVMRHRLLSLRAFDADGMMIDADITDGDQVEALIRRLLANEAAACLHVHNAKRGCFSCRIDRA
jgi:hypothetical protein